MTGEHRADDTPTPPTGFTPPPHTQPHTGLPGAPPLADPASTPGPRSADLPLPPPVAVLPGAATPPPHVVLPEPQPGPPAALPGTPAHPPTQPTADQALSGPPGPVPPGSPSWAAYSAPMRGVDHNLDPHLHPRYHEAQQAAATRLNLHWGISAFVLGYLLFHVAGLLIAALSAGHFRGFDADTPILGPLLLLSFAPNLFLGLVPAVASWWKGAGPRRDFGLVPTLRDIKVGLACGAVSIGLGFGINLVVLRLRGDAESAAGLPLHQDKSIWLFLFALFLFLGAPLTEELLTRGALWGALEQYRVPRYAILALTALVFSLMHQEPDRTVALFAQGAAMGWARMLTGRVGASIVAHAVNNLLPALIVFFGIAGTS